MISQSSKYINKNPIMWYLFVLCIAVASSFGQNHAQPYIPRSNEEANGLIFVGEGAGSTCGKSFGMVMICPSHAHGSPSQAYDKLRGIVKEYPKDKVTSIWICRANQLHSVRMFGQLVDRIVVNPFASLNNQRPQKSDFVWPDIYHPIINNIRQLRKNATQKQLLACVNIEGEPDFYKKRKATFEEVKWMVLTVLGAGYEGIVWRGNRNSCPFDERLQILEHFLNKKASDLRISKPVNWANSVSPHSCSALASNRNLYVFLLNPEYCKRYLENTGFEIPLKEEGKSGTIELLLPPKTGVLSVEALLGGKVQLIGHEKPKANYEFKGSGEILVFKLTKDTDKLKMLSLNDNEDVVTQFKAKTILSKNKDNNGIAKVILEMFERISDATILDIEGAQTPSSGKQEPLILPGIAKHILQGNKQFSETVDQDGITENERGLEAAIFKQGHLIWITEGCTRSVAELCMVLPFLRIPDNQWVDSHVESLPTWLRTKEFMKYLEEFALSIRRPRTAYSFARYMLSNNNVVSNHDYVEYLTTVSSISQKQCDYLSAIYYIQVAFNEANSAIQPHKAGRLSFRLAQILDCIGHTNTASILLTSTLSKTQDTDLWNKCAILKTNFLIKAGHYIEATEYVKMALTDLRCNSNEAELCYLLWLAYYREGAMQEANIAKSIMSEKHKNHPLFAEIILTEFKNALEKGVVEEARYWKDLFELQYVGSRAQLELSKLESEIDGKPILKL